MAMPSSTANWHWKNKNVTPWAKEWFERELVTITVKGDRDAGVVSVSSVTDVEGDVELGQRKSKLITIYDTKISLKWTGTASDGTEVHGSLTIPEVSHEVTLDGLSDYTYNWTLSTTSSPVVDALFKVAKSHLPAALESKFAEFPKAIIDIHGKDLTVSAEPSRSATPAQGASSTSSTSNAFKASAVAMGNSRPMERKDVNLNTTNVTVEANFQASADDLYSLLTDERRIPAWTRAPAKSIPEPGAEYSLFGGGVSGVYVSLTPSKEIVQTWGLKSPTWPAGHTGTLTTTFEQSTDSTKVTFSLNGVPVGMQDEIKRNIEGYYIHGFKSIGYVALVLSEPVYTTSYMEEHKRSSAIQYDDKSTGSYITAVVIAVAVMAAAFSIPYFSTLPPK